MLGVRKGSALVERLFLVRRNKLRYGANVDNYKTGSEREIPNHIY